ncbi:MAG: hypothetical protein JWN11_433 [Hyphomicrobiales bacterium]|nr:hypothetical protein [Hyphomicrobiales bacterium]
MRKILASITAIALAATLTVGEVGSAIAQQESLASKGDSYVPQHYWGYQPQGNWGYEQRSDYGYYNRYRGYRHQTPSYRYNDGFGFSSGAFLGLFLGSIIGGAVLRGGGGHVQWCHNNYRSYRHYDNTYQPFSGPRRRCVSPY